MAKVEMTTHLHRFFPVLAQQPLEVPAGSVAQVLKAVDEIAPGFSNYIVDEHGALRQHVNLSLNNTIVVDRKTLTDYVDDNSTLFIFQSLTGG